jgi:hypothetical protein
MTSRPWDSPRTAVWCVAVAASLALTACGGGGGGGDAGSAPSPNQGLLRSAAEGEVVAYFQQKLVERTAARCCRKPAWTRTTC